MSGLSFEGVGNVVGGLIGGLGGGLTKAAASPNTLAGAMAGGTVGAAAGSVTVLGDVVTVPAGAAIGAIAGGSKDFSEGFVSGAQTGWNTGGTAGKWLDDKIAQMTKADNKANEKPSTGDAVPPCKDCDEIAADAPGVPGEEDGYIPPKNYDGKKVRSPNGKGYGWLDKKGNVWVPTGPGPLAHGGPHWDVQRPNGGYINVYPGGKTR